MNTQIQQIRLSVLFVLCSLFTLAACGNAGYTYIEPDIQTYIVAIEPLDSSLSTFKVSERIEINPKNISHLALTPDILAGLQEIKDKSITLDDRVGNSHDLGFMLKEVNIEPLKAITLSPDGYVPFQLPVTLCGTECATSTVTLSNMPVDSFFEAKSKTPPQISRYGDKETVTWTVLNLNEGITFSYMPTPFQYTRPILSPFVGLASLNQWVVAVGGIVVTFFVIPLVLPFVTDAEKKSLSSIWTKLFGRQSARTENLIVSGKGNEKASTTGQIKDDS